MHHIHKSQLARTARKAGESQLRDALRSQLLVPGLSNAHRQRIREQIQRVGGPKQYPLIRPQPPQGENR